jgi:hypothetical protein
MMAADIFAQQLNEAHPDVAGLGGVKPFRKAHPVVLVDEREVPFRVGATGERDLCRQSRGMSVFQRIGNQFGGDKRQRQSFFRGQRTIKRALKRK